MNQYFYLGKEILSWKIKMKQLGGRRLDLEWMLDIGGGLNWDETQKMILYPNNEYKLLHSLDFLETIWRKHLVEHYPLQYLVGRCPWRDFELESSPDALIPRQETELLIDFALKRVESENPGKWADLGTGSGPLAVALARNLPLWEGHIVEKKSNALELASKNLQRLAPLANLNLYLGDWWKPLHEFEGQIDLVVSNPPYIPESLLNSLHPVVKNHEPYFALCGGADGMDSIKKIIDGASKSLSKGGWILLEHHYDQSDIVLEYMDQKGLKDLCYEKDLEGIKRFAVGRRSFQ